MIANSSGGRALVLLTAAVSPNVGGRVALADPAIRLRQYQRAIDEWSLRLADLGFQLAVVETTGASPKDLLRQVGVERASQISVISFEPSASQTQRGKGAAELAAIRAAVEHYGFAGPDDTLYKCTGRLIVENAPRVLAHLGSRAVKVRMTLDRSWVDTRFLGATVQTWRDHIFQDVDLVDDASGRYLERVVAARLAAASALGEVTIEQFSERPRLSGVSGSTGKPYLARTAWLKNLALRPLEILLSDIASRKQV